MKRIFSIRRKEEKDEVISSLKRYEPLFERLNAVMDHVLILILSSNSTETDSDNLVTRLKKSTG